MCGIVGKLYFKNEITALKERLTIQDSHGKLYHRGSDDMW